MFKFLIGIVAIQIVTVGLVMLAPEDLQGIAWLRLLIPLLVVALFSAFWFSSLANHKSKDELSSLQEKHAREREKIQVNAERAKTRMMKKTQQEIAKEAKLTHGKANFKVGATLAGAMGFGALMLLTEMLTLGIMTITTAGGALSGYFYRGYKERKRTALNNAPIIEETTKILPKVVNKLK